MAAKAPIRLEFVLSNNKLTITNGFDQLMAGFEKSAQKGARMMVKYFQDGIKEIMGSLKALERTGMFSLMGGKAGSGASLTKVQGQITGALKSISVLGDAATMIKKQLDAADRAAKLAAAGKTARTPQGIPIKFDDAMIAKLTKAFGIMGGGGKGSIGSELTRANTTLDKILTTLQAGFKYNPTAKGGGTKRKTKPDYTGEPDLTDFFDEGVSNVYAKGSKTRTQTLRNLFGGSAAVSYAFNKKTGTYDRSKVQVRSVDPAFVGAVQGQINSMLTGRGLTTPFQTTTSGINAKGIRTVIEHYVDLTTNEVLKKRLGVDANGNVVSAALQISPVKKVSSPITTPAYTGPKSMPLPDRAKDPFFQAQMQAQGRALAQSLGLDLVGSSLIRKPGRPDETVETYERKSGIFSQGAKITVSSLRGFRHETLQSLSAWEKLTKAWKIGGQVWSGVGKAIGFGITGLTLGLNKLLTSPKFASFLYVLSRIKAGLEFSVINPFKTLENNVRSTTERFREFEISISGSVGGLPRARQISGEIARSSITGGLPLTLEALQDSARQQSFIASESPNLSRGTVGDARKRIEDFARLTTKLGIIDPEQGVRGAGIAVREFLAGESRSLRFRFEISPAQLAATIGKTLSEVEKDPELGKKALETFTNIFVPDNALDAMNKLVSVQIQHFKDALSVGFAKIGNSGYFDSLSRRMQEFTSSLFGFIDSKDFDKYAQRISRAMTRVIDNIFKAVAVFMGKLSTGMSQQFASPAETLVGTVTNLVEKIAELSNALPAIGSVVGATIGSLADLLDKLITKLASTLDNFNDLAYAANNPGETLVSGAMKLGYRMMGPSYAGAITANYHEPRKGFTFGSGGGDILKGWKSLVDQGEFTAGVNKLVDVGSGSLLPQTQGVVQAFQQLATTSQLEKTPLDFMLDYARKSYTNTYGTADNKMGLLDVYKAIEARHGERLNSMRGSLKWLQGNLDVENDPDRFMETSAALQRLRGYYDAAPSDFAAAKQAMAGSIIAGTRGFSTGLLRFGKDMSPDFYDRYRGSILMGTTPWDKAMLGVLSQIDETKYGVHNGQQYNPFLFSNLEDRDKISRLQGYVTGGLESAERKGVRGDLYSRDVQLMQLRELTGKNIGGKSIVDLLQGQYDTTLGRYNTAVGQNDLYGIQSEGFNLAQIGALLEDTKGKVRALTRETNDLRKSWVDFGESARNALESGLGDAIYNLITGVGSLKDAFRSFAQSVLKSFSDMMAHNFVQALMGDLGRTGGQNTSNTGLGVMLGQAALRGVGGLFGAGFRGSPASDGGGGAIIQSDLNGPDWDLALMANGGLLAGGIQFFAKGGRVKGRRPRLGVVGEGKHDEAIIPMPQGYVPLEERMGRLIARLPGGRGIPAQLNSITSTMASSLGRAQASGMTLGSSMAPPSAPVVEVHEGDTYVVSSPEEAFLRGFNKHKDKMINASARNVSKGGRLARAIRRPMF